MGYIEFESMSVEEFELTMKTRSFWYQDGMGFWRKMMVCLWLGLIVLMILESVGVLPTTSSNGFWAGIFGIIGIPIIGIVDYYQFQKDWR